MTATTRPVPLGRAFLTVWAGQTVSLIGTTATAVGAALWAYMQTGSVLWLSLLMLANQVPALVLSPMAGALVDRRSRRRILLAADSVAAVGTVTAIAVHLAIGLQPWHLVLVILVGSAANAFQEPAYQASLPMLVPREALGRANGLLQLAPGASLIAGAPFAGAALAAGGIAAVLAVDLATFAVAVLATSLTPIPDPRSSPAGPAVDHEVAPPKGTMRAVWQHLSGERRGLRRILLGFAGVNLMLGTTNVLVLALALSVSNPAAAGFVSGLAGLAMVAASVVIGARGVAGDRVRGILVGIAGVGIGLVVAGARPHVVVVAAGVMVMLASVPVASAASNTLFMELIAPEWQGRLHAFRRVVSGALMPVSIILVAPLVDLLAEPAMAPGGALAGTVGALIGTGTGRGIALVFVIAGVGVLGMVAGMALDPAVRTSPGRGRSAHQSLVSSELTPAS